MVELEKQIEEVLNT
jgi:hypothetical protein